MLLVGPNKDHIQELKAQLAREFDIKDLGLTNKILGMQIHRDRKDRKIWISQINYLWKVLRRFNMQDCKLISTQLPINYKLSSCMTLYVQGQILHKQWERSYDLWWILVKSIGMLLRKS